MVLAALAALVACSSPASRGEDLRTVALLRAVVTSSASHDAFVEALAARGYVLDRNVRIIPSSPAEVHADPADVTATVERWVDEESVDVIVAYSTTGARLAADAAPRTPVVFVSNDPVSSGLVTNETEPEANLTGVTFSVPEDRTLSLAERTVPGLRTVGFAMPDGDPAAAAHRDGISTAARQLGIGVRVATFEDADDAPRTVERLARSGIDAIVMANSPRAILARESIIDAATAARLPVIANTDVATGAVVIVSPDGPALNRQLGTQVARLLDGASVRDVPVEDPRSLRVIIDARQASRLGIEVPGDVLREAHEVVR